MDLNCRVRSSSLDHDNPWAESFKIEALQYRPFKPLNVNFQIVDLGRCVLLTDCRQGGHQNRGILTLNPVGNMRVNHRRFQSCPAAHIACPYFNLTVG